MAGSFSDSPLPNSSFFNIYTDGGPVATHSPAPMVPGGRCNYVDLSHGANGPRCGCQRFYGTSPSGNPNIGAQANHFLSCVCEHHACFHDHDQVQPMQRLLATPMIPVAGQENEKPRVSREPLTPVMPDLSFQMPPPTTTQPGDLYAFNNASTFTDMFQDLQAYEGENPRTQQDPSLPDTLNWSNLLPSQPAHNVEAVPSISSQCLLPASQPSSTTSSARINYLKPFGGKGLNTLRTPNSKLREPLQIEPDQVRPERELGQHSVAFSLDDLQTVTNTPRSTRSARRVDAVIHMPDAATKGPSHENLLELTSTVQGHEERIDRLETVSFQNDHEDCRDQHDQSDLRVTELETRVEELEKTLNDSSSVGSSQHHRRRHTVDDSTASVISVSTTASGRTDRTELHNELAFLKAQLVHIQATPFPCHSKPWEVEVVFLPFPLRGIWYESREFPSQRLSNSASIDADDWTQLPNSSSTLEHQSSGMYEWVGPDLQSEWLMPRACAAGNVVDQRLRSRGLIKTIAVRSPDARSVQQAVSVAFGTLFRTMSRMQTHAYHGSITHQRASRFLGLQQPWVPLRKIHKDSRLRFLSPPEMVTPTSWDVQFLSSSVVMKATGVHRLFITQPEAYLQIGDAHGNAWGWNRLRELSRVYPDSQTSQEVPEADAMEDCWAWNSKLDEQASSQDSTNSISLRQAAQPRHKSVTPSQHPLYTSRTAISPSLTTSRSRAGSPALLGERKSSIPRPIRVRTTSMPPTLPPMASPSQGRLRIASTTFGNVRPHPYERRSSPQVLRASTGSAHALVKATYRRSTRSPSIPLSARLRLTPRFTTSSPSPLLATMNIGDPFAVISSEGDIQAACRQTTPFYYATPHSNAPPVETRSNRGIMEPEEDHGSDTDYSYEDAQGTEVDSEDEDGDSPMLDLGHPQPIYEDSDGNEWQGRRQQLPEDEPWPGIEDEENCDPEVLAFDDVDVYVDEDAMSDVLDAEAQNAHAGSQHSSVPSEYPSTQHAWTDGAEEFKVYEDAKGQIGQTVLRDS